MSKKLSAGIVVCFLLLITGIVFLFPKTQILCANTESCINDLSGKRETENKGLFLGKVVYAPDLPENIDSKPSQATSVLGDQTGDF
ncbi:hypothetical protein KKF69_07435, partial [Patescibacteria group bacterium]|nr:hypothetical protein [Patescibacteria group bacterium]